jgi:hypothetical protein
MMAPYSDSDREAISRFRYLTGKKPLGGYGWTLALGWGQVQRSEVRRHFERYDTMDGFSLGEAATSWTINTCEPPARPTFIPPQRQEPMWLDDDEVHNPIVRLKSGLPDRRYYPAFWDGVFPENPQEKAIRLATEARAAAKEEERKRAEEHAKHVAAREQREEDERAERRRQYEKILADSLVRRMLVILSTPTFSGMVVLVDNVVRKAPKEAPWMVINEWHRNRLVQWCREHDWGTEVVSEELIPRSRQLEGLPI